MRVVKRASDTETACDQRGKKIHGSTHKGKLSILGGKIMGGDAKPNGFLGKDPGRPAGGAGARP
jgi:hypothetical protein